MSSEIFDGIYITGEADSISNGKALNSGNIYIQ
jgi:hypothetical protein